MNATSGLAPVMVREVGEESRAIVERLAQLERHDLSEFRGTVPNADGVYEIRWLPSFFEDPERRAYLIECDGALAGFALTRPLDGGATSLTAFFVVRALRRRGVGHRAALDLLRQRPGKWGIAFQEENPSAARFWRRVATDAVGSDWVEEPRPVPDKPDLPPDIWVFLDSSSLVGSVR
ncbi:MAG TPA: GNAT family N-acetyltransferase [Jiangellaceae bacterium]